MPTSQWIPAVQYSHKKQVAFLQTPVDVRFGLSGAFLLPFEVRQTTEILVMSLALTIVFAKTPEVPRGSISLIWVDQSNVDVHLVDTVWERGSADGVLSVRRLRRSVLMCRSRQPNN